METQYFKAYSDKIVKYLLGSERNKDVLLAFINAVLEDTGVEPIVEVQIMNPFNDKTIETDKEIILDIHAKDENGKLYNIEIQSTKETYFVTRTLYYWAKTYSSQLSEGQGYGELCPTISINIINFNLFTDSNDIHSWFNLTKSGDTETVLTDHISIHFLELTKLTKDKPEIAKINNKLEKFLYFLKYEGMEDYDMYILTKDDPEIAKLHKEYKSFTKNKKYREWYNAEEEAERRRITEIEYAIYERAMKDAKRMLSEGLDIDLISRVTELSKEEILKLKEDK